MCKFNEKDDTLVLKKTIHWTQEHNSIASNRRTDLPMKKKIEV